jgi:hypothetical protein
VIKLLFAIGVVAHVFFFEVKAPVVVPVAAGADGAQLEHGFGDSKTPARAGDAHSILDEVTACALDDASGNRQPVGEELSVVDVERVLAQVFDSRVERRTVRGGESSIGRRLADGGHDVEGMAGEQLHQDVSDPGVSLLVLAGAEQQRDLPEVVITWIRSSTRVMGMLRFSASASTCSICFSSPSTSTTLRRLPSGLRRLGFVEHPGDTSAEALDHACGYALVLRPRRLVRARSSSSTLRDRAEAVRARPCAVRT